MGPGRCPLLCLVAFALAGCTGARLTAAGSTPAVGSAVASSLTPPPPPPDGPLVRRYYGAGRDGERAAHGLTDAELDAVTEALARRRPGETPRLRAPTALQRARAEADRYTPTGDARGNVPGGVCIDIKRLVDFLGSLFR